MDNNRVNQLVEVGYKLQVIEPLIADQSPYL